jgi:thioredoxin-related protein
MKNIYIPILLFVLSFQLYAQETKKAEVNWISFEQAVELNKKNPKPLLIDVYTDWCGWCKKMDKTTYQNDKLVQYINDNFHAVKLDGEGKKDITYKDYTFKYQKQGRRGYNEFAAALLDGKLSYPTTVFMNAEMQLLDRVPGYLNEKIMEQVTTYFATEKYKTEKWEDFVKNFKSSL